MQKTAYSKRLYIIISIIVLVLISLVAFIVFITRDTGKNQYGDRIRIQNYGDVVKNLPEDIRDSTEAYLYNVVKLNYKDELSGADVHDAYIRSDSHSQEFSNATNTRDGEYIIDIESLKQSYSAQYLYSTDEYNRNVNGNPITISCLPVEKLKFGSFDCTDLMSSEAGVTNILLQHLPFQNFSFKITPVITEGALSLKVRLNISAIDLSGDDASKRETVGLYKSEVIKWIESKGADASTYTINYNYNDDGVVIDTSDDPTIRLGD